MAPVKYNIARLRKSLGLNQKELAAKLEIKQSFLSAIENGKSPLPADKERKLANLFPGVNLSDFLERNDADSASEGAHSTHRKPVMPSESGMIKELLTYFHSQAHKEKDEHHELLHMQMNSFQERNDRLTEKNEKLQEKNEALAARIDEMRDELLAVRSENLRLKELLMANKIPY